MEEAVNHEAQEAAEEAAARAKAGMEDKKEKTFFVKKSAGFFRPR